MDDKPLVWLRGELKTPPFSREARVKAGTLLRRLQRGERFGMPHSRPMRTVGRRCHELRIDDMGKTWRIVYRLDSDAVVIADVFQKRTSGLRVASFRIVSAGCGTTTEQEEEI